MNWTLRRCRERNKSNLNNFELFSINRTVFILRNLALFILVLVGVFLIFKDLHYGYIQYSRPNINDYNNINQFKNTLKETKTFISVPWPKTLYSSDVSKLNTPKGQITEVFNNSNQPLLVIVICYKNRIYQLESSRRHVTAQARTHRKQPRVIIHYVNQYHSKAFNRGYLLNIGFLIALRHGYSGLTDIPVCVNLVDIDMYSLPIVDELVCSKPLHGLKQLERIRWKNGYRQDLAFGGSNVFQPIHFIDVGGMTNVFEGWGQEDDDLRIRVFKYSTSGRKQYKKFELPAEFSAHTSNPRDAQERNKTKIRQHLALISKSALLRFYDGIFQGADAFVVSSRDIQNIIIPESINLSEKSKFAEYSDENHEDVFRHIRKGYKSHSAKSWSDGVVFEGTWLEGDLPMSLHDKAMRRPEVIYTSIIDPKYLNNYPKREVTFLIRGVDVRRALCPLSGTNSIDVSQYLFYLDIDWIKQISHKIKIARANEDILQVESPTPLKLNFSEGIPKVFSKLYSRYPGTVIRSNIGIPYFLERMNNIRGVRLLKPDVKKRQVKPATSENYCLKSSRYRYDSAIKAYNEHAEIGFFPLIRSVCKQAINDPILIQNSKKFKNLVEFEYSGPKQAWSIDSPIYPVLKDNRYSLEPNKSYIPDDIHISKTVEKELIEISQNSSKRHLLDINDFHYKNVSLILLNSHIENHELNMSNGIESYFNSLENDSKPLNFLFPVVKEPNTKMLSLYNRKIFRVRYLSYSLPENCSEKFCLPKVIVESLSKKFRYPIFRTTNFNIAKFLVSDIDNKVSIVWITESSNILPQRIGPLFSSSYFKFNEQENYNSNIINSPTGMKNCYNKMCPRVFYGYKIINNMSISFENLEYKNFLKENKSKNITNIFAKIDLFNKSNIMHKTLTMNKFLSKSKNNYNFHNKIKSKVNSKEMEKNLNSYMNVFMKIIDEIKSGDNLSSIISRDYNTKMEFKKESKNIFHSKRVEHRNNSNDSSNEYPIYEYGNKGNFMEKDFGDYSGIKKSTGYRVLNTDESHHSDKIEQFYVHKSILPESLEEIHDQVEAMMNIAWFSLWSKEEKEIICPEKFHSRKPVLYWPPSDNSNLYPLNGKSKNIVRHPQDPGLVARYIDNKKLHIKVIEYSRDVQDLHSFLMTQTSLKENYPVTEEKIDTVVTMIADNKPTYFVGHRPITKSSVIYYFREIDPTEGWKNLKFLQK